MFVVTAKLSKSKLVAVGLALAAVGLLVVLIAFSDGAEAQKPVGETNDDRIAYLAGFGWSVNAEPTEAQQVRIPDTAENRVFARYNELQRSQGFDLTDYAGRDVMRYVYEILDYPDATDPVYASVLVCDGVIIGGDITNTAPDGQIHGFALPGSPQATVPPETTENETTTEAEPSSSVE